MMSIIRIFAPHLACNLRDGIMLNAAFRASAPRSRLRRSLHVCARKFRLSPPFFHEKSDGLLCLMFLLPQCLCCAQIGSEKVDVCPNEPPPVRKTGFGNTLFLLCFLVFSIKAWVECRALLASVDPVALIPLCEAWGKHHGCSCSLGCGVCGACVVAVSGTQQKHGWKQPGWLWPHCLYPDPCSNSLSTFGYENHCDERHTLNHTHSLTSVLAVTHCCYCLSFIPPFLSLYIRSKTYNAWDVLTAAGCDYSAIKILCWVRVAHVTYSIHLDLLNEKSTLWFRLLWNTETFLV